MQKARPINNFESPFWMVMVSKKTIRQFWQIITPRIFKRHSREAVTQFKRRSDKNFLLYIFYNPHLHDLQNSRKNNSYGYQNNQNNPRSRNFSPLYEVDNRLHANGQRQRNQSRKNRIAYNLKNIFFIYRKESCQAPPRTEQHLFFARFHVFLILNINRILNRKYSIKI